MVISRKYFPFPLELYDEPLLELLPAFENAVVRLVCEYYWKNGRELPDDDFQAAVRLRMDLRLWCRYKVTIKPALDNIYPVMIDARMKAEKKALAQRNKGISLGKSKHTRHFAKNINKPASLVDTKDMHAKVNAVRNSDDVNYRNRPGTYDYIERNKAKKNNETASDFIFKDK